MSEWREKVMLIVQSIPCGETLSYGEVAKLAGNPKAARAVGALMKKNFDPSIPCHRVIGKNGKMTGYNRVGGVEAKRERLIAEGYLYTKN